MEFRDLKKQYRKNKRKINSAIKKVLKEGVFIGGSPVQELEDKLAEYVGVKYCITCANGTDALTLVLMAWGIGPGDAVFVPDFTFFATAEAPAFLGATPVFVDVDKDTFNMDPNSLEQAINEVNKEGHLKSKVVIPVDLFGLPADYDRIVPIAKKYNLFVLEDAAQGFGGSLRNHKAGSFGDASITSFFPVKPLGCYGDGGAIFTEDDNLMEIITSLKTHGSNNNDKYDNIRIGMNSRLDTIQAEILKVKLDIFKDYELNQIIKNTVTIKSKLSSIYKFQMIPDKYISSYAQLSIILQSLHERENFIRFLKAKNIPTYIYYKKPLSTLIAMNQRSINMKNKVTHHISERIVSIPIGSYLKSKEIKKIISTLILFKRNEN